MSVSTYVPDSTKILHTAYADFVSRQIGRVIHVVQYDDGLPLLAVKLFSDGQPYTIPANADINIKLGKSDGTFVYNSALGCDSARHIVYFEITYQMVILAEKVSPVVEVIIGSSVAASSSISIIIDRNPIQKGSIESTSEWKMIQQSVEYAKEAISSAASAAASRSAASTSETNAKTSEISAATSAANAALSASSAASSASSAATSAANARTSEINTKTSETNAAESEYRARTNANESEIYGLISKSYAVGDTGYRSGENTDNAKYYSGQADSAMHKAKTSEYNADIYSLLARSYAVGDGAAVLGNDDFVLVDSDGAAIEFFGRGGESTDNAKYYAGQAKKYAESISGAEETVSADLQESLAALAEIRTLSSQVSADKASVDSSEASTRTYMENALEYSNSAKESETNAKASETKVLEAEINAKASETNAKQSEDNAELSAANAKSSEENAKDSEDACSTYSKIVRSYAVGDTDYRENENIDNVKYYYQQVKQIGEGVGGALLPMGTIAFSNLAIQTKVSGYMFNISDAFISDDTFKDGGGIKYPAGTNVYYTADGYWDCLAGSLLSGVKGDAETEYRTGFVNITPESIGAYRIDDVDRLVAAINRAVSGLTETISQLTARVNELEYNVGLAHLLDSDGNELVTNNDEILLTD